MPFENYRRSRDNVHFDILVWNFKCRVANLKLRVQLKTTSKPTCYFQINNLFLNEPRHDKINKVTVRPAKIQTSLIRVFAVRLMGS